MTSDIEELRRPSRTPYVPAIKPPIVYKHPEGWTPGVRMDGESGSITTAPVETPDPIWEEHLKRWGFDPELHEIVEPIQVRTWDAIVKGEDGLPNTKQLWYYKAGIRRRKVDLRYADTIDLLAEIKRHRFQQPRDTPGGMAYVICPSDLQIGKGEGGGTPAIVARYLDTIGQATLRLGELRRIGRKYRTGYLLLPGDGVEGCSGFYAQQRFTVDLNRRDQEKVARRLYATTIQHFAPMFEEFYVAAVPSNHGENRDDSGKSFTDFADNADCAIVECLAEQFALASAYNHVSFIVPNDELAITLNIEGVITGLAHGHQVRTSGEAAHKVVAWWKGQAFGELPVGNAKILITGHKHSYLSVESFGRTLFQCPSLDGGSKWFTDVTGDHAPPGLLTLSIGSGWGERGWGDLGLLTPHG